MSMSRRTFAGSIVAGAAAVALGSKSRAAAPSGRWLLFTKSAGYEHSVIQRKGANPSHLAKSLSPIFAERNLELVESKDGTQFDSSTIGTFSGFIFYTSGDLTTPGNDKQPPMSAQGKQNLLDAIAAGTPFIGLHCASDTFHSPADGPIDPFIKMVGGEFDSHGEQQVATLKLVDIGFPGVGARRDWTFNEEWYGLKNLGDDLRVIHELQTAGMKGEMYQRDPFPLTWTRAHGKGRVFYTGLAHREDVIASPTFLNLIRGAVDWCRNA